MPSPRSGVGMLVSGTNMLTRLTPREHATRPGMQLLKGELL